MENELNLWQVVFTCIWVVSLMACCIIPFEWMLHREENRVNQRKNKVSHPRKLLVRKLSYIPIAIVYILMTVVIPYVLVIFWIVMYYRRWWFEQLALYEKENTRYIINTKEEI